MQVDAREIARWRRAIPLLLCYSDAQIVRLVAAIEQKFKQEKQDA